MFSGKILELDRIFDERVCELRRRQVRRRKRLTFLYGLRGGSVPNRIGRDCVSELCRRNISGIDRIELGRLYQLLGGAVPNERWSIGVLFVQRGNLFVDGRFEHERMRFLHPR